MLANFEKRYFKDGAKVYLGKYYDLKSMAHWHNEIELIYVRKGRLKIGVNSETYYASEHDLVLCNSGDIHYCDSENQSTITDILIFSHELVRSVNNSFRLVSPYICALDLEKNNLDVNNLLTSIANELKSTMM